MRVSDASAPPPVPPIKKEPEPLTMAEAPAKDGVVFERLPGREMSDPVFSASLAHVLHTVDGALHFDGALVKTRPGVRLDGGLRFAEEGPRWMAGGTQDDGGSVFVMPDREIVVRGTIKGVWTSRDLRVVAHVSRRDAEDTLFLDGQPVLSYNHIRDVRLSRDGTRWACVEVKNPLPAPGDPPGGERVVVNGRRMESVYDAVTGLILSADGKRTAFVARRRDASGILHELIADDTVIDQARGEASVFSGLAFSPDGNWLAHVARKPGARPRIIVEGQPVIEIGDEVAAGTGENLDAGPLRIGPVRFSPDSRHVACVAAAVRAVLYRDGRIAATHPSIDVDSPVWSPDSLHLAFSSSSPLEPPRGDKGGTQTQTQSTTLWDNDRALQVINTRVTRLREDAAARLGGYEHMTYSPDSEFLACTVQAFSQRHGLTHLGVHVNGSSLSGTTPPVPPVRAVRWDADGNLRLISEQAGNPGRLTRETITLDR
ncbi:MAG: PD40 domain-containing protein [Verrucomicrobiaceae bacterium]|nr:PD40 domain-containing protein [Verrucomicrobiaceae bacterium]